MPEITLEALQAPAAATKPISLDALGGTSEISLEALGDAPKPLGALGTTTPYGGPADVGMGGFAAPPTLQQGIETQQAQRQAAFEIAEVNALIDAMGGSGQVIQPPGPSGLPPGTMIPPGVSVPDMSGPGLQRPQLASDLPSHWEQLKPKERLAHLNDRRAAAGLKPVTELPQQKDLAEWLIKDFSPTKWIPFVGSMMGLAETGDVYLAAQRAESGRANADDWRMLSAYYQRVVDASRGQTFGANVSNILQESIPFMGEWLASGGLVGGAKKAASEAVEAGTEAALKESGKRAVGELARLPAFTPRIAENLADLRMPDVVMSTNKDREAITLSMQPPDESFLKSLYKAVGGTAIEILSEGSGRVINTLGDAAKASRVVRATREQLGRLRGRIVAKEAIKRNKPIWSVWDDLDRVGYQGIAPEIIEEELARLGSAAAGVEPYPDMSLEDRGAEAAAIAVPGAAGHAVSRSSAKTQKQIRSILERSTSPEGMQEAVEAVEPIEGKHLAETAAEVKWQDAGGERSARAIAYDEERGRLTVETPEGSTEYIDLAEVTNRKTLQELGPVIQAAMEAEEAAPEPDTMGMPVATPGAGPVIEQEMRQNVAATPGETVRPADIQSYVTQRTGVPFRTGLAAQLRKKAAGIYKVLPEVIRTREALDVVVSLHEVGHHLYKKAELATMLAGPNMEAARKDLLAAGQELYPDMKDQSALLNEGVAEYMRYYGMTEQAEQRFPAFHSAFREFLRQNPHLQETIDTVRQMSRRWVLQGAERRFEAKTVTGRITTPKTREQRLLELKAGFLDPGAALKQAVKEAEASGGKQLRPSENPYALFTAFAMKSQNVLDNWVNQYQADKIGRKIGPSLNEIYRPVTSSAEKMAAFDNYAKALRVVRGFEVSEQEGNRLLEQLGLQAPPGFKQKGQKPISFGYRLEDAQYIVEKYKDDTEINSVLDGKKKWFDNLVQYLKDLDILDPQFEESFKKLWGDTYAPMVEPMRERGGVRAPAPIVGTTQPLKGRREGGGERLGDIEGTLLVTGRAIAAAHRMSIAKAIANLATIEGMGKWVEEVHLDPKSVTVGIEQLPGVLNKAGFAEEAESVKAAIKAVNEGEATKEIADSLTFWMASDRYTGREDVFPIWTGEEGGLRWFQLDPALADAVAYVDPAQMNAVVRAFAFMTAQRKLGITGIDPGFHVWNMFRDTWTYLLLSEASLPTATKNIAKAYMDVFGTSFLGKKDTAAAKLAAVGGRVSALHRTDWKNMKISRDRVMSGGKKSRLAARVIRHPSEWLPAMLQLGELAAEKIGFGEMAPRVAEYNYILQDRLKKGWDPWDAHLEAFNLGAQEITTNFSRKGVYYRYIDAFMPYANAALQGNLRILRALDPRNPKQAARVVSRGFALVTLPSLAYWLAVKDDEEWKTAAPWKKYGMMKIPLGWGADATSVWVPMPWTMGIIFGGMPMAIADAIYQQEPLAAQEGFTELVEELLPVGVPRDRSWQGLAEVFSNLTLIGPTLEIYRNRTGFSDRPVEPVGMQDVLPGYRYHEWTGDAYRWIGERFPTSVSPAKLERWFQQNFPAQHKVVQATESLIEILNGGDWPTELRKTKIARRILGYETPGVDRRVTERFYDDLHYLQQLQATEKKIGLSPTAKERRRFMSPEDRMRLSWLTAGKKSVDVLQDALRAVPESDTQRRQELERKINQVMRRSLDGADRYKGDQ